MEDGAAGWALGTDVGCCEAEGLAAGGAVTVVAPAAAVALALAGFCLFASMTVMRGGGSSSSSPLCWRAFPDVVAVDGVGADPVLEVAGPEVDPETLGPLVVDGSFDDDAAAGFEGGRLMRGGGPSSPEAGEALDLVGTEAALFEASACALEDAPAPLAVAPTAAPPLAGLALVDVGVA